MDLTCILFGLFMLAVGFLLRHAYQGKFAKAEEVADKAKNYWDANK